MGRDDNPADRARGKCVGTGVGERVVCENGCKGLVDQPSLDPGSVHKPIHWNRPKRHRSFFLSLVLSIFFYGPILVRSFVLLDLHDSCAYIQYSIQTCIQLVSRLCQHLVVYVCMNIWMYVFISNSTTHIRTIMYRNDTQYSQKTAYGETERLWDCWRCVHRQSCLPAWVCTMEASILHTARTSIHV